MAQLQKAILKISFDEPTIEQSFPVYEGENFIGRSSGCNIAIKDQSISKKHAVILVENGEHFVRDLASKNKTYRKKAPLRPEAYYELTDGCQLVFGKLVGLYSFDNGNSRKSLGQSVPPVISIDSRSNTPDFATGQKLESTTSNTADNEYDLIDSPQLLHSPPLLECSDVPTEQKGSQKVAVSQEVPDQSGFLCLQDTPDTGKGDEQQEPATKDDDDTDVSDMETLNGSTTTRDKDADPTVPYDGGADPTVPYDGGSDPTVPYDGGADPTVPYDGGADPTVPYDGGADPTVPYDGGADPTVPYDGGADPTVPYDGGADPTVPYNGGADPTVPYDGGADPTVPYDGGADPTVCHESPATSDTGHEKQDPSENPKCQTEGSCPITDRTASNDINPASGDRDLTVTVNERLPNHKHSADRMTYSCSESPDISIASPDTPLTTTQESLAEPMETNTVTSGSTGPQTNPSTSKPADSSYPPLIMFTGIEDANLARTVKSLGGSIVEADCTHLVTDKMRRTVKFLCSVARGCQIVNLKWIDKCKKEKRFVETEPFVLKDKAFEKKHEFILTQSLERARANGGILNGYSVCFSENVKPTIKDLSDIVKSAGGNVVQSLPSTPLDCTLLVAAEEDVGIFGGPINKGQKVYSTEFLFSSVLKQSLELGQNRLHSVDESQRVAATPPRRSRKRAATSTDLGSIKRKRSNLK